MCYKIGSGAFDKKGDYPDRLHTSPEEGYLSETQ